MAEFTEEEKKQMRTAAFGAVFLVSQADPGMFDSVKESFAASKSLAKAPPEVQEIFRSGGLPKMPKGDRARIEQELLGQLSSSVELISTKDPVDLDAYRNAVIDACTSAAESAGGGVQPSETAMIDKVMSAMGMR